MERLGAIGGEVSNSVRRLGIDLHVTVETGPRSEVLVSNGCSAITVKVVKRKGECVRNKLEKATPLRALMHDYCLCRGVAFGEVMFGFNGRVIRERQAAHDLGLEDGDVIHAWLEI